jgi:hypothetical protein
METTPKKRGRPRKTAPPEDDLIGTAEIVDRTAAVP